MAIPSSGPITLANIQTEFGGSNPISLGEYYAGGGLVPAGTTGTYGAVPSSGAISIRNFYGTSNIPALSVTGGSSSSGYASRVNAGSETVSTSTVSVSASGGVPAYSYLWQYVSGETFSVSNSTSATTGFAKTLTVDFPGDVDMASGIYQCRVTDSVGSVAYGPEVTVEATLEYAF